MEEKAVDKATGKVLVEVNPKYFRPTEVETLLGDCTKAKTKLGWAPKTPFKELVEMMVEHDLKLEGLDRKDILKRSAPVR